jgi:predicted membrane-bound spermidine synthase
MEEMSTSPPTFDVLLRRRYVLPILMLLLATELLALAGLGTPYLQRVFIGPWNVWNTLSSVNVIAAGWVLLYAAGNARARDSAACMLVAIAMTAFVAWSTGGHHDWTLPELCDVTVCAAAALMLLHVAVLSRTSSAHAVWAQDVLQLFVLIALFGLLLVQLQNFTTILHPLTHDPELYRLDGALGFNPAKSAGVLAIDLHTDRALLYCAHVLSVAAPWLLIGLYLRKGFDGRTTRLLDLVILSGVALCFTYNLYPATGPWATFQKLFPAGLPALELMPIEQGMVITSARDAMPALNFGWAVALFALSFAFTRGVRWLFGAFMVLDAFAAIASGQHYLIDLVVALPLMLMLFALTSRVPWPGLRRAAAVIGAALYIAWLALLKTSIAFVVDHPALLMLAVVITVAASALLFARLQRTAASADSTVPALARTTARGEPWFLYGMFFISGAAALIYQVLFSKQLTYVFGSMSTATNTVLATYMGGMALGAWLGGLIAPRLRKPVAAYALCEVLIAIYCAVSPWIFKLVQAIYIGLAAGQTPDAAGLLPLRVLLGGAGLIVPTVLMGLTLPILARFFEQRQEALGLSVGRLYAANTLGAGLGALSAGYFILPALGLARTTMVAVAANLLVAYLGMRFQKTQALLPEAETPNTASSTQFPGTRKQGWIAIVVLAGGGFVTLALEVDFIHLLAVAAGNSTYAFSLMLFAFLIGLGGGAEAGRWLMRRIEPLQLLAWLEFGLCSAILFSVSRIDRIPEYFASFEHYPIALGWSTREVIRGLVCCLAMVPPAFFIGAIFPVAMECVGRGFPGRPIRMLGFAAALNTLGNIFGVLIAGFLLLPAIGPMPSVTILAGLCVLLGVLAAAGAGYLRTALIPVGALAVVFVFFPPTLNYDRLTNGANVYFRTQSWGNTIDHAESLDGGLTTINQAVFPNGDKLLTLLTNGKFQGNDAVTGEMLAQVGFAMAPLLHNDRRETALVIGYGTGNTSRVLHEAGFRQLDVADLSADIFRLANRHMEKVNGRVTDKPGVKAYVTDGRNFLLLSHNKYDVISMEISSIWFAGAASLYSRDFYHLASAHLAEGGVLQQWMQVHHASPLDLFYVLGSARAEFRYVWLYMIGGQGIIVATNSAQAVPSQAHITAIDSRPEMKSTIEHYGGSAARVVNDLLLDPDAVDRFLASRGVPAGYFISDDDNAHLEYSTPKGNALSLEESEDINNQMLTKFATPAGETPTAR